MHCLTGGRRVGQAFYFDYDIWVVDEDSSGGRTSLTHGTLSFPGVDENSMFGQESYELHSNLPVMQR